MKIGVFDSGIGGVTVLSELRARFPHLSYVYLGDTANVPYGTKSTSQIKQLSVACARVLKSRRIDALIVACNTASSHAMNEIREVMGSIPVFGVVEPGVTAALSAAQAGAQDTPILVLATRATVRSGAYGKGLAEAQQGANAVHPVIEQACPLLVPMIEEGWVDHPILLQTIQEYVAPYALKYQQGVALLGCTHYPWVHRGFQAALPGWTIVNSAQAIATMFEQSHLLDHARNFRKPRPVEWIFTDPDVVPAFAVNLIEKHDDDEVESR